jgi:hypothetical protein
VRAGRFAAVFHRIGQAWLRPGESHQQSHLPRERMPRWSGRIIECQNPLYTDLAGPVTRGEYRPLDGTRHSPLTIDRPDDVVRAVRDLIGMASR